MNTGATVTVRAPDGDEEEIWNGVLPEMMSKKAPPLSEAQGRQTALQFTLFSVNLAGDLPTQR